MTVYTCMRAAMLVAMLFSVSADTSKCTMGDAACRLLKVSESKSASYTAIPYTMKERQLLKTDVAIPPGCKPGSTFKANVPDGRQIVVTVPPNPTGDRISVNYPTTPDHGGFLVLKIARSGSSWFADLVNKMDDITMLEEGITHSTGSEFSASNKTFYIHRTLCGATLNNRISSYRDAFTRSRSHPNKWIMGCRTIGTSNSSAKFHGLSISPLSNFDLNLTDILYGVLDPHLQKITKYKFVVYTRTNIIKMGVAKEHGNKIHRQCGVTNFNEHMSAEKLKCVEGISTPYPNLSMETITRKSIQMEILIAAANRTAVPYLSINYEELQKNKSQVLKRLKAYLNVPWLGDVAEGIVTSKYSKSSSDNLVDIVPNYAEFVKMLQRRSVEKLNEKGPVQRQRRKFAYNCLIRMAQSVAVGESFPECLPQKDGSGVRLLNLGVTEVVGKKIINKYKHELEYFLPDFKQEYKETNRLG